MFHLAQVTTAEEAEEQIRRHRWRQLRGAELFDGAGKTTSLTNPSTGEVLADIAWASPEDVAWEFRAIEAAKAREGCISDPVSRIMFRVTPIKDDRGKSSHD